MDIKEITVGSDVKISRNYNTIGESMQVTASVGLGDDVEKIREALDKYVHDHLQKKMAESVQALDQIK